MVVFDYIPFPILTSSSGESFSYFPIPFNLKYIFPKST